MGPMGSKAANGPEFSVRLNDAERTSHVTAYLPHRKASAVQGSTVDGRTPAPL